MNNENLALFNYLEKCRLHMDLYTASKSRVTELIYERRLLIDKWTSNSHILSNTELEAIIELLKINNQNIKQQLHL